MEIKEKSPAVPFNNVANVSELDPSSTCRQSWQSAGCGSFNYSGFTSCITVQLSPDEGDAAKNAEKLIGAISTAANDIVLIPEGIFPVTLSGPIMVPSNVVIKGVGSTSELQITLPTENHLFALTSVQNVSIEYLKVTRTDSNIKQPNYNFFFDTCSQCQLLGVESNYSAGAHVALSNCKNISISGCAISNCYHVAFSTGGFGINIYGSSSENLVENNGFGSLLSAIILQDQACYNVVAYNYSYSGIRKNFPLSMKPSMDPAVKAEIVSNYSEENRMNPESVKQRYSWLDMGVFSTGGTSGPSHNLFEGNFANVMGLVNKPDVSTLLEWDQQDLLFFNVFPMGTENYFFRNAVLGFCSPCWLAQDDDKNYCVNNVIANAMIQKNVLWEFRVARGRNHHMEEQEVPPLYRVPSQNYGNQTLHKPTTDLVDSTNYLECSSFYLSTAPEFFTRAGTDAQWPCYGKGAAAYLPSDAEIFSLANVLPAQLRGIQSANEFTPSPLLTPSAS